MSQKELGLAVIGSGRIGSLRAILASGHPAVKYLGVSDINIENFSNISLMCVFIIKIVCNAMIID